MTQLFFSHSSEDGALVRRLLKLLKDGAGITKARTFCTSDPSTIPLTRDWVRYISRKLTRSSLFIPVLSDAYADSAFSLVELGASWALSKKTLPIVVPPFDYGDDLEILRRTQHCQIDQRNDLLELHEALKRCRGLTGTRPAGSWDESVRQFLAELPPLLSRAEYWVYALRAIRDRKLLSVFGCFEVTPVPRTQQASAVDVKGQCYWVERGQLRDRGNWRLNVHALREPNQLFLFYHMKGAQVEPVMRPEEHDGIIFLRKQSGTPLIGDNYYKGSVNDIREYKNTSGDIFAERLKKGEDSWDCALRLVQEKGPKLFKQFTQR